MFYDSFAKGRDGEDFVEEALNSIGVKYVRNVCIPSYKEGYTNQIDFVAVSECGVFIIEVKNNRGIVEGSENDALWYLRFVRRYQNDRYQKIGNPILQNCTHRRSLKKLLKNKISLDNLVVYSNPDVDLRVKSEEVCTIDELFYIFAFRKKQLDKEQVYSLFDEILYIKKKYSHLNEKHSEQQKRWLGGS